MYAHHTQLNDEAGLIHVGLVLKQPVRQLETLTATNIVRLIRFESFDNLAKDRLTLDLVSGAGARELAGRLKLAPSAIGGFWRLVWSRSVPHSHHFPRAMRLFELGMYTTEHMIDGVKVAPGTAKLDQLANWMGSFTSKTHWIKKSAGAVIRDLAQTAAARTDRIDMARAMTQGLKTTTDALPPLQLTSHRSSDTGSVVHDQHTFLCALVQKLSMAHNHDYDFPPPPAPNGLCSNCKTDPAEWAGLCSPCRVGVITLPTGHATDPMYHPDVYPSRKQPPIQRPAVKLDPANPLSDCPVCGKEVAFNTICDTCYFWGQARDIITEPPEQLTHAQKRKIDADLLETRAMQELQRENRVNKSIGRLKNALEPRDDDSFWMDSGTRKKPARPRSPLGLMSA